MTRAAYGLLRAASAFWSTLTRRPPPEAPGKAAEAPRGTLSRGLRQAGIENRCPVCLARFRGVRVCSRCGADLEPLMRLTVKSWQLRQAARQALDAGNAERAWRLVSEAQGIQSTASGEALQLLSAWLRRDSAPESP